MKSTPARVAGVDEAGRGPLAGPVVAAAVVFPHDYHHAQITDSKKLSAQKREKLVEEIRRDALAWAVVAIGHHRIVQHNIRGASLLGMSLALRRVHADFVLVDGNARIPTATPQKTVIGGDALHVQISAASILAKVWRDHLMVLCDQKYPGYSLGHHAGYPTPAHRAAIRALGPCPIHRRTFSGVAEYLHITAAPVVAPTPAETANSQIFADAPMEDSAIFLDGSNR